jgi:hypothetical protein
MRPNWNFLLSGQQVPWFADQVSTPQGILTFPSVQNKVVEKYCFQFRIFKVLCQFGSFFQFSESYIIYFIEQYGYIFFGGGGGGV